MEVSVAKESQQQVKKRSENTPKVRKSTFKGFSFSIEEENPAKNFTSVLDNIEKGLTVPTVKGEKLAKKEAKSKKVETAGEKWYDLPATKVTPEIQMDLKLLTMRNYIDPKRHYKKWNTKDTPKYFHVGTVIEGPTDFYNSRLTKKERKQGFVDELLADAEFKKYTKRKFLEVQEMKQSGGKKQYNKMKAKRQKKF